MNFEELHPSLNKDVLIKYVENDTYILTQKKYKYQFYINSSTKTLLELVDGKNSIKDIANKYNVTSDVNLSSDEVYKLLYTKFSSKGIIIDSKPIQERKSASYLKLRINLFKSSWLQLAAKLTNPIFIPKAYLTIFAVCIVYLVYLLIAKAIPFYETSQAMQQLSLSTVLGYILLTSIIHEFGHALAITSYGLRAGNIGFGFYLFSPVFYTDVSEIWALPLKKRILVNLAGIYTETLLLVLLCILPISKIILLQFILIFFSRLLINSIPLLRFDGYWILSDLSGYPNLNVNARNHFLNCIKAFLVGKAKQIKFNTFLFFYGLCNTLMILLFLIVCFSMIKSFIDFPSKVIAVFTQKVVITKLAPGTFVNDYLFPFAFYFLSIKWLLTRFLKYIKPFRS